MSSFFSRVCRQTFVTLQRKALVSVLFIIFLSILFYFLSFFALIGIGLEKSITSAEKRIDILFLFEQDVEESRKEFVLNDAQKLQETGDILQYTFYTKEEAKEYLKEKYPDKFAFLETFQLKNPLADSLIVIPGNMSIAECVSHFTSPRFTGIIDRKFIDQGADERVRAEKILRTLSVLQRGIYIVSVLFFAGIIILLALFISSSFLARREEIFIMRLVGASHFFIRTPFLLESLIISGVGLLGGLELFILSRRSTVLNIYSFFTTKVEKEAIRDLLNATYRTFYEFFPFFAGGIMFLLVCVAFFAVEIHLRRKNILHDA